VRRNFVLSVVLSLACLATAGEKASAQFGRSGAEWVTNGSDAQRSFSIPTDSKISGDAMQKPGFQFLWKVKLNNEPVQLNSLTPAVLIDRYIGYRGFRSFAFVAGSSNTISAVDTDLNRIEWQVHLPVAAAPAGTLACPGGLTANIARATTAAYPIALAGGGGLGGRGEPARSSVGAPRDGAVTIAPALAAAAAAAAAPGGARGPQLRIPSFIYAVAGDGTLRTINISNGAEPESPLKFLPPNANAQGLTVIDGIAYAATPSCNGTVSGVRALDLASKQISEWHPSAGVIAGSAGPAFGPDGTVYASSTGGELVALDPMTLVVRDTYATGGTEFSSSPVVFAFKERNLVAATTKDGRIQLLDTRSLGGTDHRTPLFATAAYSSDFAPTALATWQASEGTRWLLAAGAGAPSAGSGFSPMNGPITNGAVAAWKVAEQGGALTLQPAWLSRDMISPLPPMIINGVVFAVSSGEYRSSDSKLTAAQRAQKSSPAVLYALDATTGKSLWDSGRTITSFVHSGGLSGGASQLYLQTYDQYLYAFGYPIEH
jgi:outer membrane protein assembly factor BamB